MLGCVVEGSDRQRIYGIGASDRSHLNISYCAVANFLAAHAALILALSGSLEILDRALALGRTLVELPFELNLWQAQNIWYEILRASSSGLTALTTDDRPRWDKDFSELGSCLSIDSAAISAQEPAVATTGD